MTEKQIHWEKWVDPFVLENEDEHDGKYPGFIQEAEEPEKHKYKQPIIVGPWGIIPVTEMNRPSKTFNFWIGHTNFVIQHKIRDMIEEVSGVETLDVFSPYRMRIAIGKSFDEEEVKHLINEAIQKEKSKENQSFSSYLDSLREQLSKMDTNDGESKD